MICFTTGKLSLNPIGIFAFHFSKYVIIDQTIPGNYANLLSKSVKKGNCLSLVCFDPSAVDIILIALNLKKGGLNIF